MTQHYVGTKIVKAWPQDRATIEGPKSTTVPGYAVMYEDGYTSWCPKDKFEAANVPLGVLDNLPPHAQRVIAERATLNDRRAKLDAFLASDESGALTYEDRLLLNEQRAVMSSYADVLWRRLVAMNVQERAAHA